MWEKKKKHQEINGEASIKYKSCSWIYIDTNSHSTVIVNDVTNKKKEPIHIIVSMRESERERKTMFVFSWRQNKMLYLNNSLHTCYPHFWSRQYCHRIVASQFSFQLHQYQNTLAVAFLHCINYPISPSLQSIFCFFFRWAIQMVCGIFTVEIDDRVDGICCWMGVASVGGRSSWRCGW